MRSSRTAHRTVTESPPFQLLARIGLVTYGVVHLLVAWLCLQLAVGDLDGDGVGKTDKTGALQAIAAGGAWLLWLITVGLAATALWQLAKAIAGDPPDPQHRLMSLGEAVLFGYLSFSAGKIAAGSPSSTDAAQFGLIDQLLGRSWGKPVVIAIGVAIIVAAVFVVRHGLAKRFLREQDGRTPHRVVTLGQVGYTALGGVYGVAGALVVVAAVKADPAKATGLDVALKTLAVQPFGPPLLLLITAGLAAFGVFALFDARYRR
jgi:hypothetical protein